MSVIKTEALTKYYGKNKGIENLNLEVQEGEIFGFIGPNGAGKSTTIRTLLGFLKPTSGKGWVLGKDITANLKEAKRWIGYLPSEVQYYDDMSAGKLLSYSAKFYGNQYQEKIKELASYFELDLNKNVDELSYGNRKKVGIIQALIHQPKLLILDEPTGGLDPLMQNKFFELIEEEKRRGTTIFFSSHILSEVQRLCDRVGIIKDGSLIRVEALEEIRKVNYKKIQLELRNERENQQAQFKEKDIHDVSINGKIAKFIYSGSMEGLKTLLTQQDFTNIWIEDPSLEEIFMYYYQ